MSNEPKVNVSVDCSIAALIVVIFLGLALFGNSTGQPSLHDAILYRLTDGKVALPVEHKEASK